MPLEDLAGMGGTSLLGVRVALCLAAAFLAGALPFGLWIGRLARGIDVRRHGSGNLGATNVLRVLGPGWGIVTLILDIAKGWAAVTLLPSAFGLASGSLAPFCPLVVAVCAVLGHVFSPFAKFRGGKGVATSLGSFLALAPLPALIGVAGFALAFGLWRFVSVASLVMQGAFIVAVLAMKPGPLGLRVAVTGLFIGGLVAWRHRANWARLRAGQEPKLGGKK